MPPLDLRDVKAGCRLGKHLLLRLLGQGGMGIVHEAEDTFLRRRVAVKIIARPLDADAEGRLLREAQAAACLSHPNVIAVHEIDEQDGIFYLVMELVPGGSVQALLRERGELPWGEASRLIADACRGLVAAHAAGIIHRDIKPANLLIMADGAVKVADFGLALAPGGSESPPSDAWLLRGTPCFMSPEQCRGDPVDERSDIYSLGATYFALLTGAPPYGDSGPIATLLAHCLKSVPDPRSRRADVPAACAAIISRAMAKEPADRYAHAAEFLADLESVLRSGPVRKPTAAPRRSVLVTLAGLMIGAALAPTRLPTWHAPAEPTPPLPAVAPAAPILRDFLAEGTVNTRGAVEDMAFSPNDAHLAWLTSASNELHVWRLRDGLRHNALIVDRPNCLAWSANARTLAVGTADSTLHFWAPGNELVQLPGLENLNGGINAAAFSRDGKLLAVGMRPWGGPGVRVRVWRWRDGPGPLVWCNRGNAVVALAFSGDSQTLATAGVDGKIELWEAATGRLRKNWSTAPDVVCALAFSGDGKSLVGALGEKMSGLRVWDTRTGAESVSFPKDMGHLASVAFSPDGRLLVSGGTDGVRFWNPRTGTPRREPLDEHRAGLLRGLCFSHDGSILATGASDWALRIRHVERLNLSPEEVQP